MMKIPRKFGLRDDPRRQFQVNRPPACWLVALPLVLAPPPAATAPVWDEGREAWLDAAPRVEVRDAGARPAAGDSGRRDEVHDASRRPEVLDAEPRDQVLDAAPRPERR